MARSGSWERDARTGALRWSANPRRIFGLTPGDGEPDVVTTARALVHPADRERFLAEATELRERGVLRTSPSHAHVAHICVKLGATDRAAAVATPMRLGPIA